MLPAAVASRHSEILLPSHALVGLFKLLLEGTVEHPAAVQELLTEAYHAAAQVHRMLAPLLHHSQSHGDLEEAAQTLDSAVQHIMNALRSLRQTPIADSTLRQQRMEALYPIALYVLYQLQEIDLTVLVGEPSAAQPVNLNHVLQTVANFTRDQCQRRNCCLKLQAPRSTQDIFVWTNYQSLLQTLLNLVANVIRSSQNSTATIRIKVVPPAGAIAETQAGTVNLYLADDELDHTVLTLNRCCCPDTRLSSKAPGSLIHV